MTGSRTDSSLAAPSARAVELHDRMLAFMQEHVLPAEAEYLEHRRQAGPDGHEVPPVVEQLKKTAQEQGLWNLFLPSESGLTQLEYAPIAELSGWSNDLAPEAINCQAPDTGNMELLHLLGTPAQQRDWLEPLLAGQIRSAFAMTEPDVASSDATNIATRIERDGDEYVITGRKWWTSGAMDPRCAVLIVMGKTDPSAPTHRQQTMVIVPRDTPGVTVVRDLPVFGHHDQHGHAEVRFDGVRVPGEQRRGRGGRRLRRGAGPPRAGTHPPLHAGARRRRARAGADGAARPAAGRLRRPARRPGRRPGADRRVAAGDRAGPTAVPPRLPGHRHRRQQGRPDAGGAGQGRRPARRHRPSSTGRSRCTAAPASPT